MIDVHIKDPDPTNCAGGSGRGEFLNLPPSVLGVDGVDGYGGIFALLNASCLPEFFLPGRQIVWLCHARFQVY